MDRNFDSMVLIHDGWIFDSFRSKSLAKMCMLIQSNPLENSLDESKSN